MTAAVVGVSRVLLLGFHPTLRLVIVVSLVIQFSATMMMWSSRPVAGRGVVLAMHHRPIHGRQQHSTPRACRVHWKRRRAGRSLSTVGFHSTSFANVPSDATGRIFGVGRGGGDGGTSLQDSSQSTPKRSTVTRNTTSTATCTSGTTTTPPKKYRVHLAVGSNLGDRFANIQEAVRRLVYVPNRDHTDIVHHAVDVRVVRTSCLHETAPMYQTDQPSFLNGALVVETDLEPLALLQRLKEIEAELGRNFESVRNGPRPVDLDILAYQECCHDDVTVVDGNEGKIGVVPVVVNTSVLTIPHPRIHEREFVLVPLSEVSGLDIPLPGMNETIGSLLQSLQEQQPSNLESSEPAAVRVLPLSRDRMLHFNQTLIMGILNVTPDSFSDGGHYTSSVDAAVTRALEMVHQGASIIDVGGESTRPGAEEMTIDEELKRTIVVIEKIRQVSSTVPISIDTRHAAVAEAAVLAGADMVNDVSGGTFDPLMLSTVGALGVPMILMHMRGTPETMQSMTEYDNDVVTEVGAVLLQHSQLAAQQHGIYQWSQILDPGIGFAKDVGGNLRLLKHLGAIRTSVRNLPVLLGTSRKGFLGRLSGETDAAKRDPGTIASCVAALCLDHGSRSSGSGGGAPACTILRVHNVAECKQAVVVMDAILNVE